MTMAERPEKGSMRILEMGCLKRKSAVQSFRHFLMMIKKRLEAVHSTWKTCPGTGKKFSVLHKISGSDGSVRCDIVDDRINGKALHQPVELFSR